MASSISTSDILSGLYAPVTDGEISQTSTTSSSTSSTSETAGGELGKDAFLQLLVAQMQNQDPMDPQDNSEMVSQLATFSSLEEMQNMSSTMDKQRASSMVGQVVSVSTTDSSTGITKTAEGVVDYVTFSGSDTYVSIDGTLYNADDVTAIEDSEYTVAVKLANSFTSSISNLGSISSLNSDDLEDIGTLVSGYSSMDSYQKSMISDSTLSAYNNYAAWYAVNEKLDSLMDDLPKVSELTEDDYEDVSELVDTYNDYSSVQKSLISTDILKEYNKYLDWYAANSQD